VAKRLRAPFTWIGGKHLWLKNSCLNTETPHVCGGVWWCCNLLLAKEPSAVEVYNDIDSGLVNFFRVIRDKDKFKRFYEQVMLIPYSREEFYYCRDAWRDEEDDILRAVNGS